MILEHEVVPEFAPKERSNGECEVAVKQVQGMIKTFHEEQTLHGIALDARHPVLAWLIEHAATVLTCMERVIPVMGSHPTSA
eukprot:3309374-Amphidinium_carterae.1